MSTEALAAIGTALSGAGSAASAFGLGGRTTTGDAIKGQLAYDLNKFQHLASGAKKAGLHPLFALGGSAGGSIATVGSRDDPGAGIAGIGDAITRYSQQKVAQQQLQNQTAVSNAQVTEATARANLANTQARKIENDMLTKQVAASLAARAGQKSAATTRDPQAIVSPFGTVTPGPHTPAEYVEQEYGGAAGEVYGLGRVFGEFGKWLGKQAFGWHRRRNRNQRFDEWTDYDTCTAP